MRATVLLFQVAAEKRAKLAVLCHKCRITMKIVEQNQYSLPLEAILRGEKAEAQTPLEGEMLLMAGFSAVQLQQFLVGFRNERIAPIALKAMLTPSNRAWDAYTLYQHLSTEHALRTATMQDGWDVLLCGGTVYDGSGQQGVLADVAIQSGKIAALGHLSSGKAQKRIDCTGKCVTPGFLDIHRHADAAVFRPGFGKLELMQGLTTIVNGNCGLSVAPAGGRYAAEIRHYLQPVTGDFGEEIPTASMKDYLDSCRTQQLPIHVGMLAGNGTARAAVCGYEILHPNDAQFSAIHARLEQSLADGALGVSLGLGYAPECFYNTQELIRALQPLANSGIPITVHMRQEGDGVLNSVQEMAEVAKALHTPVHISHLKAMGRRNWGKKIPKVLELIAQERQNGLDLSCDVYPYTAGSTQLMHILPPDFLEGGMEAVVARLRDSVQREILRDRIENGKDFDNIAQLVGWENIVLSSMRLPEHQELVGLTIAEAAEKRGQDAFSCCCDLLAEEHCEITMVDYITCEEDIAAILRVPFSHIISDSTYPTQGMPHPRLYGTFARAVEHYVCKQKVLPLQTMIQKLTLEPAKVLGLNSKGRLTIGADADVNIFDPAAIHEMGTYADPSHCATGFDTILVGGNLAVEHGRLTGQCGGSVLCR